MKQLTLADEIVVLMLRDDTGEIRRECAKVANIATAAGVLMELSLLGRIDTDMKSLFIVEPTSVDDDLLDPALREIAAEPTRRSSAWWIERLGAQSRDLLHKVLERLVRAGILRVENRQYFWFLSRRAYPQQTGREEREAKARLLSVIHGDEVPAPRDTLLLGLAESSGVLNSILSAEEIRKIANRVSEVVALEEIGRSVRTVASELRVALTAISAPLFQVARASAGATVADSFARKTLNSLIALRGYQQVRRVLSDATTELTILDTLPD